MRMQLIASIVALSFLGVPALSGCDRTVHEEKTVKTNPDTGQTTVKEKKTTESPNGTRTTTEEKKTVNNP